MQGKPLFGEDRIMSNTKKMLVAAVGAMAMGTAANAANIIITPKVSYFGTSVADLQTFNHPVSAPGGAGFYEVDFYVKANLSAADATAGFYGLGNVDFNIAASGGVARQGGYVGDAANSTVNGNQGMQNGYWGNTLAASKGQTLTQQWGVNTDGGANAADGLDIQVGIPAGLPNSDPRVTWGQDGQAAVLQGYENLATNNPGATNFFVGYQIVNYTGGAGSIGGAVVNPAVQGYSLYNGSSVGPQVGPGQSFTLNQLAFGSGTVPEPMSLSLLALGGLLSVRRRRA